jgi:AcrR family transcriptional regulator
MPQQGRRKANQVLLAALACGATVEAAANKAGVSPATVYRRLKEREFRKELQRLRSEMMQRMADMLAAAGGEAVKSLLALLKDGGPATVRLGAARSVIELAVKLREAADFEPRIAALEGQPRPRI